MGLAIPPRGLIFFLERDFTLQSINSIIALPFIFFMVDQCKTSLKFPSWIEGFDKNIGPLSFTKKFVRSVRYNLHFFVRTKACLVRLGLRAQLGNPG